jgi:hypothetical protein
MLDFQQFKPGVIRQILFEIYCYNVPKSNSHCWIVIVSEFALQGNLESCLGSIASFEQSHFKSITIAKCGDAAKWRPDLCPS